MSPPNRSLQIVDSTPPKPPRRNYKAEVALETYKTLQDRSLAKLAVELRQNGGKGPSLRTLESWSSTYDWQAQIAEYERERAEKRRRDREEQLDKMNDDHVVIARASYSKAIRILNKLEEADAISAKDALAFLKIGLDLERLARGAATESTIQHMQVTGKEGEPPVRTQNMNIGFYAVQLPQKDDPAS